MKTYLGGLLYDLLEFNKKTIADDIDTLERINGEIINGNKDLTKDIKEIIGSLENEAICSYVCPECGGELEFQYDSLNNIYVPYGDTMVCATRGGDIVCGSCDYKVE